MSGIFHEPSTPAGDKAVEAAYHAEHEARATLAGDTLAVEVGDHTLLPDQFEGVVLTCLQGACEWEASINPPPPMDALYHVVCLNGHDVSIGPSQLAWILETRS